MAYFPLFLNLDGADVLVVGGGQTALRKCRSVLAFGADVTVISPEFAGEFPNQAHLMKRRFQPGDTSGRAMVLACTDDRAVNRQIAQEAQQQNIPVNVADDPELCTFYFPALVRDGDVVVGVSSGGKSPLIAQELRQKIEKILPEGIGEINDAMGVYRQKLQGGDGPASPAERKRLLQKKLEELRKQ